MSLPGTARRQRPISGWALLLWVAGAGAAFLVLFLLITAILRQMPEPIGPNANLFVQGALLTLQLTVVSGVLGLIIGLVAGIMKTSASVLVRAPASVFVWLIRGTPLLVQILFTYNAVPASFYEPLQTFLNGVLGRLPCLELPGVPPVCALPRPMPDEFLPAVLALALNVGAYNAEVIRAGIQAVPRGQTEAARSLGLSAGQTMNAVVLPQALRIVVPPLVNNVVALLKDSSLASTIALLELSLAGQRVSSESFMPVPVLTTVAAVYLSLTTVMTLFTDQLEKRVKIASR